MHMEQPTDGFLVGPSMADEPLADEPLAGEPLACAARKSAPVTLRSLREYTKIMHLHVHVYRLDTIMSVPVP